MRVWLSGFGDEIEPVLEVQLQKMQELGIQAIELRGVNGKNISALTVEEAMAAKATLDAYGFRVSALGTPIGKTDIGAPLADTMATLRHTLVLAKVLDAPALRIFSFFVPQGEADVHQAEVLSRLAAMKTVALEAGITLLHENEVGIFGDSPARCAVLANALCGEGFHLIFDPSNFVQCGFDALEAWHALKPWVTYLHIKDSVLLPKGCEPQANPHRVAGDGQAQIPTILADLKAIGYEGFLSIEPHLAHGTHVPGTPKEQWTAAALALEALLDQQNIAWRIPMDTVRFGIIGMGNMGKGHTRNFLSGKIPEGRLTAVCDTNPKKLDAARELLAGQDVAFFDDAIALMDSGLVDAILIATPHYFHPTIAIDAFKRHIHVMSEKPAGVYTQQVREMNDAAAASDCVFGIMFQHRREPIHMKMKDILSSGELGDLKRINLIFTDWYRNQAYYDSGSWRATWGGEGGGVLANQCPHSLDLWQWLVGELPVKVRGYCHEGKWHNIEVEDDVSAYLEYQSGATCLFTTCTADAPGLNRIEITGDKGRLLAENGRLTFYQLETSEREHNSVCTEGFKAPAYTVIDVPLTGEFLWHPTILNNFCRAILRGEPLYIPGEEGIKGLTLCNAIMLSSWLDREITLPLDEALFKQELDKRIATSRFDGQY